MTYKEALNAREKLQADTEAHNVRSERHRTACKQCAPRPLSLNIGGIRLRMMCEPPVKSRCADGRQLAAEAKEISRRWTESGALISSGDTKAYRAMQPSGHSIFFRYSDTRQPLGFASFVRIPDKGPYGASQRMMFHKTRRAAKARAERLYIQYVAAHVKGNERAANRLTRYGYLEDAD